MTKPAPLQWLDWPAPASVKACFSLRSHTELDASAAQSSIGQYSQPPFDHFNYAYHVGDAPDAVKCNRQYLEQTIGQHHIQWVEQVHGIAVVRAGSTQCQADAVYTSQPNQVCSIMTADCLPVFFCDQAGLQVAVAHAGWRGLASGILQQTLSQFAQPQSVMIYFGPAISQRAFEVGNEVKDVFVQQLPSLTQCFTAATDNKWMADLYGLARLLLAEKGVTQFYGGGRCTYNEADVFYSYRRDGQTGRMANLIWLS